MASARSQCETKNDLSEDLLMGIRKEVWSSGGSAKPTTESRERHVTERVFCVFNLNTKEHFSKKPIYKAMWNTLQNLSMRLITK